MKVAHIYASDLETVSEGGIATYIGELMLNQFEEHVDVALVGVTGDSGCKLRNWQKVALGEGGYNFLPILHTPGKHLTYQGKMPLNARFIFELWRNRHEILKASEILHFHRAELVIPFMFLKGARKFILTLHGASNSLELAAGHSLFNKKWFRRLYYKMEELAIGKADSVMLVSQEGYDYYAGRFPAQKHKFIFIPTFVGKEFFTPVDKQIVRKKYGLSEGNRVVLFAGRFDHQKDIDLLIEAFRIVNTKMPDSELLLAGDGKERARLEKLLGQSGIRGVRLLGMLSRPEMPELMHCADVFALTSRWEGMPIVVLEALASGLPVVATRVGQMEIMIANGLTGYLADSREPEDIAQKIIAALQTAGQMKAACIKSAQEYSSRVVFRKIRAVYAKIAGQSDSPAGKSVGSFFGKQYYDSYKSATPLRKKGDKPYLYSYFKRYLKKTKPGGRLLDVGCGLGSFLSRVQDIYETYGVDISEYAIRETGKAAPRAHLSLCDAAELQFEKEFFDVVMAFDIVEHLERPELFLKKAHDILKNDGIFIFSTHNPDSMGARLKGKKEHLKHLPYNMRKEEWAGWRDDSHINILPMNRWRQFIKESGLVIVRDGTDFLWDVPYFKHIPYRLQWLLFVGATWVLVWMKGFYPWNFGENYVCVEKKT